jgi:uncharacterized protein
MERSHHGEQSASPRCADSLRYRLYHRFIAPLVAQRLPPWCDARGVSAGLFVGLALPVGCHVAVLTGLRALFRFNYLAALLFSCVGNPITMIPLYYGYYHVGSRIAGKSPSLDFSAFQSLMHPVSESTFFWEALAAFGSLGWEILIRWGTAAFAFGTGAAILGYWAAMLAQTTRRKREARKRCMEYGALLAELEHRAGECFLGERENQPHSPTVESALRQEPLDT